VRAGEIRVQFDDLSEQLLGALNRLSANSINYPSGPKEHVVGLNAGRVFQKETFILAGVDCHSQGFRDLLGDFRLNSEDILELTVITLGPDVVPLEGIYQLRRNPWVHRRDRCLKRSERHALLAQCF